MPAKIVAAKSAAKPTAASKTAAKVKPAQVAAVKSAPLAKPAVDETGTAAPALRVKDLVERVTAAGDFKKKDVRDIVDLTLAELGRALEAGLALNLPPFGKLRIGRQRDVANGTMMTLKLRRGQAKTGGKNAAKEGLADTGDAG